MNVGNLCMAGWVLATVLAAVLATSLAFGAGWMTPHITGVSFAVLAAMNLTLLVQVGKAVHDDRAAQSAAESEGNP